MQPTQGIKVDDRHTFKIRVPDNWTWNPKKDITAFELAQSLPYFFGQPLFVDELTDEDTFVRHFDIIE